MATYGKEEILAVVNGALSATGTLYTCPANRYARVSLRATFTTGPNAVTVAGAEVLGNNPHNEIILDAGQSIALVLNLATVSYTALEFAKP
jgi:hypothetical protein